MRTLHLVRHALVKIDPEIPSAHWQLADDADVAIRQLVPQLATTSPTRIVSSPQGKAAGTASVLAAALGLKVEIRDGLEEHHRENEGFFADEAKFQETLRRFFNHPDELLFGSETARQALNRFEAAVTDVMDESNGDEIVVTHGTVMSLFLGTDAPDQFEIWRRLKLPDYRAVRWPRI